MGKPDSTELKLEALNKLLEDELGYKAICSEAERHWKPALQITLIDDNKRHVSVYQQGFGVPLHEFNYKQIAILMKHKKENLGLEWEEYTDEKS